MPGVLEFTDLVVGDTVRQGERHSTTSVGLSHLVGFLGRLDRLQWEVARTLLSEPCWLLASLDQVSGFEQGPLMLRPPCLAGNVEVVEVIT